MQITLSKKTTIKLAKLSQAVRIKGSIRSKKKKHVHFKPKV